MHSSSLDTEKKIILIGAPNSGKTTLYNWMTGARFRTVNYPGSTVEFSRGATLKLYGPEIEVLDTPGIRSLDPLSPDEKVTIECLYSETENHNSVVVVPVDATQPERHLFMVKRLQSAGFSVVVSITMMDLLKEKDIQLNVEVLSKELEAPVYVTDGRLGGGVQQLVQGLGSRFKSKSKPIRLKVQSAIEVEQIYKEVSRIVDLALQPVVKTETKVQLKERIAHAHGRSLKIDKFLMHPVFGLIFFVFTMAALFTSIFWMAQPAMDFIDENFGSWSEAIVGYGQAALWSDFLGNGLVAGVGSVLVFLPQIVILFFVLGLLEDTGYLARAASLVDKPLSAIGLNGRSFVPLLSGYACAIPAMMAARTITNRRERLLTLFAIPLMSCSARLPVWALLLGLLFANKPFYAGLGLTAIYFSSLIAGAIAATIAGRFIKKQGDSWFMLELPAYRRPHLKFVLKNVWVRSLSYIKRAGMPIVVISVIIWGLSTFPNYHEADNIEKLNSSYLAQVGHYIDPIMRPMGGDWRLGVGILAAFAAREVFVSTTAIVFRVTGDSDDAIASSLLETLKTATTADGALIFTVSTVIGLIIYFMIALQCLPTVAVARVESASRKFALIQLAVFTFGAYFLAVFVVQGLRALGVS